ncbi:hypothetical protein QCA50_020723 [Cerrena zonata]|uniref:Uncharacterized protein n=1 Tax=Cerrena zonata TaxID=2478898 RepID=A0AAW0FGC5_9APHY
MTPTVTHGPSEDEPTSCARSSSSCRDNRPDKDSNTESEVEPEPEHESDEEELKQMSQKWTSYVYAFWELKVKVVYEKDHQAHKFTCGNHFCINKGKDQGCQKTILRYLDTEDSTSTSNLT